MRHLNNWRKGARALYIRAHGRITRREAAELCQVTAPRLIVFCSAWCSRESWFKKARRKAPFMNAIRKITTRRYRITTHPKNNAHERNFRAKLVPFEESQKVDAAEKYGFVQIIARMQLRIARVQIIASRRGIFDVQPSTMMDVSKTEWA